MKTDLEPGAGQLPQKRRIGPGVSRNHEQGPGATVGQQQVAKTPKRADAQCGVVDGLLGGLAVDGPADVDWVVGDHGRILAPGPRQSITEGKRGSRDQEGTLGESVFYALGGACFYPHLLKDASRRGDYRPPLNPPCSAAKSRRSSASGKASLLSGGGTFLSPLFSVSTRPLGGGAFPGARRRDSRAPLKRRFAEGGLPSPL